MVLALAASGCGATKSDRQSPSPTASPAHVQLTTAPGPGAVQRVTWDLPMGEPVSLDYAKAGYTSVDTVVSNMNDTLLRYEPDWTLTPCIAESWSSPDPRTIVYTIRRDVEFWDGHPLTAQDVVYSLRRHKDEHVGSVWSAFYTTVADIAETGPYEVTVSFKQPDELFNKEMATAAGAVTEETFAEARGDSYGSPSAGVMGSGPYKFVSWQPGSQIVLERNTDYWDTRYEPKVQKVVVRWITDPAALSKALLSGKIDGSYEIPPREIPALSSTSKGKVTYGPGLGVSELLPTSSTGPMADPALRRALSMALDRGAIMEDVYNEAAVPNKTFTPPTAWDPEAPDVYQKAYDALPPVTPNVAAAKKIVDSRKESDRGVTLAVLAGDQKHLELATAVQQAAKRIGLNVEAKELDPADYASAFYLPEHRDDIDLILTLGYLNVPDPLDYLVYWFGPSAFFNWTDYRNATVESKLAAARRTTDAEKRAQLIVAAQKIYTNDAVVIPVCNEDVVLYMNERISGAPASFTFLWQPSFAMIGGAAPSGHISGNVTCVGADSDEGVLVEALRNGHVVASTTTNDKGAYDLALESGTYTVTVRWSRDDLETYSRQYDVTPECDFVKDVTLQVTSPGGGGSPGSSEGPTGGPTGPTGGPTTRPSVAVPNVVAMDLATAQTTLAAHGFQVSVTMKAGTGQPPGTVVDQDPPGDTTAPEGSTVTITVAQ
jgi:peptide/nickel transport system substrate-binding protein